MGRGAWGVERGGTEYEIRDTFADARDGGEDERPIQQHPPHFIPAEPERVAGAKERDEKSNVEAHHPGVGVAALKGGEAEHAQGSWKEGLQKLTAEALPFLQRRQAGGGEGAEA